MKSQKLHPRTLFLAMVGLVATGSPAAQGTQGSPGVSSQLQSILGGTLKENAGAASISTAFTPSGQPLFVDVMLAKMTLDEAQKEQFRKYSDQVTKAIEAAYTQNGFPKDDLAVALGGLLETCYELDQGTFTLASTNKARDKRNTAAVIGQVRRALASAPAFAEISDHDRQLAYEACTFTIGHLAVNWKEAGDDAAKREAVRQSAREQIQAIFRLNVSDLLRKPNGEFGTKIATSSPPQEAPKNAANGWETQTLSNGVTQLTPTGLAEGEVFTVTIFPRQPLNSKPIEEWIFGAVEADNSKPGKVVGTPKVQSSSGNIAVGTVAFQAADGKPLAGIYQAVSVDKETGRLIRIVSSPSGDLIKRYMDSIKKVSSAVIEADKKAAVADGRGLDMEKLPPTPSGMRPGGALKPGIYAGNQLYGKDVLDRKRLYLYGNGEYRMFNKEGKQTNSSVRLDYRYDARSGKLDMSNGIQDMMMNNRYEPSDDYCLYGIDAQGKPFVYAFSDRGVSTSVTTLRYVGPVDLPSPTEEKEAKERIEAEAKRYKWVTSPGQGLKPTQIKGILLNQELTSGTETKLLYDVYMVLNDGTIYNGFPVAPDEFDASLSRRHEPEKWGHWKKVGNGFAAAWPDAPTRYKAIKGDLMKPGAKGMKLTGRYGSAESSNNFTFSSYRIWGVTFTPDGHFKKDVRGGSGSATVPIEGSGMPFISSQYDDEGSATSASGENFVVASSKKNKSDGSRAGTYTIDGYTMVLHYGNGKTVRQPFFVDPGGDPGVWFEGAKLSKDKK